MPGYPGAVPMRSPFTTVLSVLVIRLDVKYGLTSNLTMDLTVNTDFAQVEADDQQINLTRFVVFSGEEALFQGAVQ